MNQERSGHRTTTPAELGRVVPPALDCMTFGATCRFARPLLPGEVERSAVAFEAIPAPLIPALPFGLGRRSDQTPSGNAITADRQSFEPTRSAVSPYTPCTFRCIVECRTVVERAENIKPVLDDRAHRGG